MKLIVGLGNPDSKYENTRHNVGFIIIDEYIKKNGYPLKHKNDFKGDIYLSKEFILLKPTTYMNLSGESVRSVSNFYKISPEDILVISDDLNLPFSKMRLREKGSAGGHNGLKNIILELGSDNFNRLRIGIGSPTDGYIDYVLGKFSKEEIKTLVELSSKTNDIIDEFIKGTKYDLIMNKYNKND